MELWPSLRLTPTPKVTRKLGNVEPSSNNPSTTVLNDFDIGDRTQKAYGSVQITAWVSPLTLSSKILHSIHCP